MQDIVPEGSTAGRALKQEWARLIKQVYEVDPLVMGDVVDGVE